MKDENAIELASAIIQQALEDYSTHIKCDTKTDNEIIEELETFFDSKWFEQLAGKRKERVLDEVKRIRRENTL